MLRNAQAAMRIELSCAICGSNRFSLDSSITDQSLIACEDCGHEIGTLASLKERVAEEVLQRAGPSIKPPPAP